MSTNDLTSAALYTADRPRRFGLIERLTTAARPQVFDQASNRSITIVDNLGNLEPGGLSASADGRTVMFARVDASLNDIMLVDGFR